MNSLHRRGLPASSVLAVLLLRGIPSSGSLPEPPLKAWCFLPQGCSIYLDPGWLFPDPCSPHHYTTRLAPVYPALDCQAVYPISPVSPVSTGTVIFIAVLHNEHTISAYLLTEISLNLIKYVLNLYKSKNAMQQGS